MINIYNSKNHNKKAQVAIFIILAILIVTAIIFISLNTDILNFGKEKIHPDIKPIHFFVKTCIEQTTENAVYYIGQTGGYYNPPINSINDIAYYFDKNKITAPSKEQIEDEISSYMERMLELCADDFDEFPNFEIKKGDIKTKTKIYSNKIMLDVEYPLTISKGSNAYLLKDFKKIEIPVRLGIIYDSINKILEDQLNHPRDLCITCITNLATENDFYIELTDYDIETIIFTITDPNSKIIGQDYKFTFANKYPTA